MTDTELLSQLINEQSKLQLETEYDRHHCVSLIEPGQSDSRIVIKNMPYDSFVIKSDKFSSPDLIFKGDRGECKRADYIIISEERKCVLFVEIKRTKDSWNEIVQQLKGSQCFLEYCQSVAKIFWNKADFLSDYKMRFISIAHTGSIQKRKPFNSREEQIGKIHDSAERAMKIAYAPRIQFKTIAALGS